MAGGEGCWGTLRDMQSMWITAFRRLRHQRAICDVAWEGDRDNNTNPLPQCLGNKKEASRRTR